MKKVSVLFLLLTVGVISAIAQSTITSIAFKEKLQPALVIQLPNSTEVAEGTILQKLKEAGYDPKQKGILFWKENKINDFYVFKNVQLPELNNLKLDMYFKVTPALNGDEAQSLISLIVSKGYDNFVSPETDTSTFYAAQKFLDGFVVNSNVFKNNLDIEAQQKSLTVAEGKLAGLQKQENEISNKIAELQSELVTNQYQQRYQQTEINNYRSRLDVLKAKVVKK